MYDPHSIKNMRHLVDAIRICETQSQIDDLLDQLARPAAPQVVSFVNAHAVNLAKSDDSFFRCILDSDVVLRDGSGMATLFHMLRRPAGKNLNGTDFIPRIAEKYRGRRVALFGTMNPWLDAAAARWRSEGLEVRHVLDGFQPPTTYVEALAKTPVDLVVLGMGMPKQEAVAMLLRQAATSPCLIVNGGAIFDFMAGRVPRAPKVLQAIGMEWMYRLWNEPQRLFKRYFFGNAAFLYASLQLARASWRRSASFSHE